MARKAKVKTKTKATKPVEVLDKYTVVTLDTRGSILESALRTLEHLSESTRIVASLATAVPFIAE